MNHRGQTRSLALHNNLATVNSALVSRDADRCRIATPSKHRRWFSTSACWQAGSHSHVYRK